MTEPKIVTPPPAGTLRLLSNGKTIDFVFPSFSSGLSLDVVNARKLSEVLSRVCDTILILEDTPSDIGIQLDLQAEFPAEGQ